MRRWRAYHPVADDQTSGDIRLGPEESHHLARVVRVRRGDVVGVFDGDGREWAAEVVEVGADGVAVRLGPLLDDAVEPDLAVTLYQGVCRSDRFDWLVQKCTEIGVSRIVPVVFARSERGSAARARPSRWRRIALEACKQCGRRRVPDIGAPIAPGEVVARGSAVVLAHEAERPLADVLAGKIGRTLDVLVGPESGLSDEEVAALVARGWSAASLGPRVLRAETAGVVAAAVAVHVCGDLGSARQR